MASKSDILKKEVVLPFEIKKIFNNAIMKVLEDHIREEHNNESALRAVEQTEETITLKLPRGIWAILKGFPQKEELISEALLTYLMGRGEDHFAAIMATAQIALLKEDPEELKKLMLKKRMERTSPVVDEIARIMMPPVSGKKND